MSTNSGTVTHKTVVTITGNSSDGAAVAAMFNGIVIPGVSATAPTAANASGVVTVIWADTGVRVGDNIARDIVVAMLAADTALTAPVTVTATSEGYLAA